MITSKRRKKKIWKGIASKSDKLYWGKLRLGKRKRSKCKLRKGRGPGQVRNGNSKRTRRGGRTRIRGGES